MKPAPISTLALAIAAILTSPTGPSSAAPYPDRSGICYYFPVGTDTPTLTQPCVLSSGYGAGAHYTVLQWADGVKTRILMINTCPSATADDQGFCRYTVDDVEALPYDRDNFFQETSPPEPDNLPCYQVLETGNSVCYRFSP
ncbi:hypothetical protein [Prochlorothrix hollandica]|uniref:hypothetical protein n=1 Tax=Prochlorothrix hollandica TaxID=1223 RepID=UPI00333F4674